MNDKEKCLQSAVESGGGDASLEALAYRKVFDALQKDTTPELSSSFADRVVKLVEGRRAAHIGKLEWSLAIVGLLFCLVIFVVAVALTGFNPDMGFLKSASPFKGILIFGVAFVLLLNVLEKFLKRKKQSA